MVGKGNNVHTHPILRGNPEVKRSLKTVFLGSWDLTVGRVGHNVSKFGTSIK